MNDPAADLQRLIRLTAAVRQVHSLLPPQCLHVLLVAAARPGITAVELEAATGLAHASVHRNITALSATHRNGKPGLGLVAQVPNAADGRASSVYLTAKGRDAVRGLLQAATGKPADDFNPRVVR